MQYTMSLTWCQLYKTVNSSEPNPYIQKNKKILLTETFYLWKQIRLIITLCILGLPSIIYIIVYKEFFEIQVQRLYLTYPPMIYRIIAIPLSIVSISGALTTLFLVYGIEGKVKPFLSKICGIASICIVLLYVISCILTKYSAEYYFAEWLLLQLFYIGDNTYIPVFVGIVLSIGCV